MTFHTIPLLYVKIVDLLVELGLARYEEDGIFRQYFATYSNYKIMKYFYYDKQLHSYVCEWQNVCFRDIRDSIENNSISMCGYSVILANLGIVKFRSEGENTNIRVEVFSKEKNKVVYAYTLSNRSDNETYDIDFFNEFQLFKTKVLQLNS